MDTTESPMALEVQVGPVVGRHVRFAEYSRVFPAWSGPAFVTNFVFASSNSLRFGISGRYEYLTFTGGCCDNPRYQWASIMALLGIVIGGGTAFETGPRFALGLHGGVPISKNEADGLKGNAGFVTTFGWNAFWRVEERWGLVADLGASVMSQSENRDFASARAELALTIGARFAVEK
jgi:hypothetical protein